MDGELQMGTAGTTTGGRLQMFEPNPFTYLPSPPMQFKFVPTLPTTAAPTTPTQQLPTAISRIAAVNLTVSTTTTTTATTTATTMIVNSSPRSSCSNHPPLPPLRHLQNINPANFSKNNKLNSNSNSNSNFVNGLLPPLSLTQPAGLINPFPVVLPPLLLGSNNGNKKNNNNNNNSNSNAAMMMVNNSNYCTDAQLAAAAAVQVVANGTKRPQRKPCRPVKSRWHLRVCQMCATVETPAWRMGPAGPRTLCNACGIRYSTMLKRISLLRSRSLNGWPDQTAA